MIKIALCEGKSAETILKSGLLPVMERVGAQFRNGEIFIPEVLALPGLCMRGWMCLDSFCLNLLEFSKVG
jgi:methanogenic corrinoid protein MtbC1